MNTRRKSLAVITIAIIVANTNVKGQVYTDFETFTVGASVDGQGGWRATNPNWDEEVADIGGNLVWRVSNAVTSGSFGDQPIAPGSGLFAGESGSIHNFTGNSPVTDRFYAQFTIRSATGAPQPGLDVTVSPDDGAGRRQSFLSIEDNGTGIDIDFFDSAGNHPMDNPNGGFQLTEIALGLSYAHPHTIAFDITFVDGNVVDMDGNVFGNDSVDIYIDGVLVHSGTTWESYYTTTTEGQAPPTKQAIDTLLFRLSTPAGMPASLIGGGYYVDNVYISDAPPAVQNLTTGGVYSTIQSAIDDASAGDVIQVSPGTYNEDVTVNTQVTIVSSGGAGDTTVAGPIGGGFATFDINASGTILDGFTVTRDGNDISTWNDPLNSAGVSIQGAGNVEVRNCIFSGNRTGIDINASSGNHIHHNKIDFNHTGMILRNGCPDNTVESNEVTNNRTVGILWLGPPFLPGDGTGCSFVNNKLDGNWYAEIENRTVDGGLKDFSGNWLGTNTPTVSTDLGAEPSYTVHIPVEFGGTATDPGGNPAVRDATALYDFTPWLDSDTDTDGGSIGFEGDFSTLNVDDDSPQSGAAGRIQEAIDLVSGSTINILPGTYVEAGQVVIDESITIVGDAIDRPVIMTDTDTGTSGSSRGMWLVMPGAVLDLSNVIFDGSGRLIWQGIRHQGSGTIDNCTFRHIKFNEAGPHYAGTGIAAFGDGTTHISNCDMFDIGRIGIQYFGAGVNGSAATGYSYTGKGDGDFLDYGFDIGGGAAVSVSDAVITGCRGVASSDGSTSAGLIVSTFFGAGTAGTIENSTINNNTTGVFAGFDEFDTATATIFNNDLSGNVSNAVRSTSSTETVNASGNWYGSSDAVDVADGVSGLVDYTPWLDNGMDTDGGTAGFQGDFSILNVDDDSPQTGGTNRIQEAIDLVVGSTVSVWPGSYAGNLNVVADVMLQSIDGAATTTINGAGGCAVSVDGDNVTIDGFTINNPTGTNAICSNNNSTLAIRNNIVTNVGAPTVGGNHHAILIEASGQAVDDVLIEDNEINDITGSETSPVGSVSAIVVGFSTGDFDLTNLVIRNNSISDIDAYTAPFGDGGRGAYGILLNLGARVDGTGRIVDPEIRGNTVTDLEGLWSHGIGLEGDTPGAVVEDNDISFLTDHKTPSDAVGVMIEQNDGANSVEIHYNRFTNMAVGMLNVTPGSVVDAEFNYWGSNSGPLDESGSYAGADAAEANEIDFLSCTASPDTEINADGTGTAVIDDSTQAVDYCPWLLGDGSLSLEIAAGCPDDSNSMEAGHQIEVELWMRDLLDPATGYQAFVTFDSMALEYRGMLSSYTNSPFPTGFDPIDMAETSPGVLTLSRFDVFNGTGTDADSLLATLVFEVTVDGECGTTSLGFDTSPASELSFEGNPLITGNVGTPMIALDDTAPMVMQDAIADCYDTLALAEAAALAATTATDNCTPTMDLTTVVENSTSSTCDTTITVRVTDACGNFTDVDYMTRIDNDAPVLTTGMLDDCYDTIANAEAAAIAATGVSDNCPGLIDVVASTVGGCDVTITVTATDFCGNSASVDYMTRVDDEAPMVAPGSIAFCYPTLAAAESAAIAEATSAATDNCIGSLDFAASTVGTCNATVSVTVTDFCGNATMVDYMTRIDNTPPVVSAMDALVPADAGMCSALVTLTASASDDCDGVFDDADLTFIIDSGNDGFGVGTDDVVMGSGSDFVFNQGVTNVRATAIDACGNEGIFDYTVTVDAVNLVNVTVTLDGVNLGMGDMVARNIEFTARDDATCDDSVCEVVTFTGAPATGSIQIEVGCGNWDTICAKDPQHTLFDTVALVINGTEYDAAATQILRGGDTDDDSDVDINDVTLFIAQFGNVDMNVGSGMNACPYNGQRNADFNLNTVVGTEDFTILQSNWLDFTSCPCSNALLDIGEDRPIFRPVNRDEITRGGRVKIQRKVLTRIQVGDAEDLQAAIDADLNEDGEVGFEDVAIFELQHGFDNRLSDAIRQVELRQFQQMNVDDRSDQSEANRVGRP